MKQYKYRINSENFIRELQEEINDLESEEIKKQVLEEGKTLKIGCVTLLLEGKELNISVDEEEYQKEVDHFFKRYYESKKEAYKNFIEKEIPSYAKHAAEENSEEAIEEIKADIEDSKHFEQYLSAKELLQSNVIASIESLLDIPGQMKKRVQLLTDESEKLFREDANRSYKRVIKETTKNMYEEERPHICQEFIVGDYQDEYIDWFYSLHNVSSIEEFEEKSVVLISLLDKHVRYDHITSQTNESIDEIDVYDFARTKWIKMKEFDDKYPEYEKGCHALLEELDKKMISCSKSELESKVKLDTVIEETVEENAAREIAPEYLIKLIPSKSLIRYAKENEEFDTSVFLDMPEMDSLACIVVSDYYEDMACDRDYDSMLTDVHEAIVDRLNEKYPNEMKEIKDREMEKAHKEYEEAMKDNEKYESLSKDLEGLDIYISQMVEDNCDSYYESGNTRKRTKKDYE